MSLNFFDYKSSFKKICVFYFAVFSFSFIFLNLNLVYAENVQDLKVDKYVNDYANIIDDNIEQELNTKLYDYFASTTNQVLVVTVNNMDGDYIESYSIKLAEKIKAGGEKDDNGVILLVAKDEKQMRIEVGYGLEPVLTDGKSSYIINNILKPEFKNGDYTTGIQKGTEEIVNILENKQDANYVDYAAENNGEANNSSGILKSLVRLPVEIYFAGFLIFIGVVQWAVSVLGRTKSWWLGGVIGFVIATIIFVFLVKSFFVFILGLVGFILDYFVSKNYKEHLSGIKNGPPDWWAGGAGFGGGGRSNSSGGGFSGGGGSFGGGGSSGSW